MRVKGLSSPSGDDPRGAEATRGWGVFWQREILSMGRGSGAAGVCWEGADVCLWTEEVGVWCWHKRGRRGEVHHSDCVAAVKFWGQ